MVATRVGGVPLTVIHGQTGLLAQAADGGSLATQMRQMICSMDTAIDLGNRARRLARLTHHPDIVGPLTYQVYREVAMSGCAPIGWQRWSGHTAPRVLGSPHGHHAPQPANHTWRGRDSTELLNSASRSAQSLHEGGFSQREHHMIAGDRSGRRIRGIHVHILPVDGCDDVCCC